MQIVPPFSPVKLFIAADEFMYVTGTVELAIPRQVLASKQGKVWSLQDLLHCRIVFELMWNRHLDNHRDDH